MLQVDAAVQVLVDRHHISDRLTPRELVRVVLVRSDEDDRPLFPRDSIQKVVTCCQVVRQPEVEDPDDLVDRSRRAGAAKDHGVLLAGSDAAPDDRPRVLAESRRLEAGPRALRVRVGVEGEHLVPDEVLDEPEGAPRRRVVGVGDPPRAIGPGHRLVRSDE